MNHRKFNGSVREVSEIGLGTWQLGGAEWGDVPDNQAIATLSAAADAGVTFIDNNVCLTRLDFQTIELQVFRIEFFPQRLQLALMLLIKLLEFPLCLFKLRLRAALLTALRGSLSGLAH